MTFAARYRALTVLIAITIATAIIHLMSVALGAVIGVALPTHVINIVAGVAFLGFATWTLRGDELTEAEAAKASQESQRSALLTVGVAFFIAELGDKTMLATITLASDNGLLGTWLGSTLGMVAADALAIVVGHVLGARLPQRAIRIGAAAVFVVVGILLIADGIRG